MMSARGLNRAIGDSGSGRWGEAVGVEGRHHGCCCFFQLACGGPERRESNKILTRTVKYSRELIFINPKIVLYDAIKIPAMGTLYFTCVLTAKQAS